MIRLRHSFFALLALSMFAGLTAVAQGATTIGEWRKAAAKKVLENKSYPRSALVREIEGNAVILLTVAADGNILNHKVLQPTGQSILDNEIPDLIKRANPLPELPAGETQSNLVIPISWSLD